jgi:beta-N-acetylhexosaminidase
LRDAPAHRRALHAEAFPGLGPVYEDTHKVTAELAAGPNELEASDWLPLRQLMSEQAFTMLGHARLTAIDRDRPASFSHAVVKGLLREQWKHDGILVTDDFSMGAVTLSQEGVARGAIAALNAGVDLILISYDPDQYFPVMHALLAADRAGALRAEALALSAARLRRAANP